MESFLWVALVSGNGTTVVFLKSLQTLSNVYKKAKFFEAIQENLGEIYFSWVTKLWVTFYISLV